MRDPNDAQKRNGVAVVVIGRNEGTRLVTCLSSCARASDRLIYVDSGSTDDSVRVARERGAEVVELDRSAPFTAARARNAGIEWLIQQHPQTELVQVIDGDCELMAGWLATGAERLRAEPSVAAVAGRRRERYPEASVYNRLIDMEWDAPTGTVDACGGDALLRVAAWRLVGGYDPRLICGEEPELCVRLRAAGFRVERLPAEMTLHDADMTRWGQWWKRAVRGGWAYAEGAAMHGRVHGHKVRETISVWLWGLALPAGALLLAWPSVGLSLLVIPLGYGLLAWRIYRGRLRRGDARDGARLYAAFCALGKFPQMLGQVQYWVNRLRGKQATLIEYKGAKTVGATGASP